MKNKHEPDLMGLMSLALFVTLLFAGISGVLYGIELLTTDGPAEICTSSKYNLHKTCDEHDGAFKQLYGLTVLIAGIVCLGVIAWAFLSTLWEKFKR